MADPTPTQTPITPSPDISPKLPGPLRCLLGSLISAGVAIAFYFLTSSIAQAFASKPIHTNNVLVANITVAFRTLVVGMSALGTGIFGLIGFGLFALAIQVLIQGRNPTIPPSDAQS